MENRQSVLHYEAWWQYFDAVRADRGLLGGHSFIVDTVRNFIHNAIGRRTPAGGGHSEM